MNWLLLSAFLQFGVLSGGAIIYDPPAFEHVVDLPCYADIGVRAEAGPFFFETDVNTYMRPVNLTDWSPTQVTFGIGGGAKIGPLTVGIKHACYHPVTPYMVYENAEIVPRFEGATNDFYIRIDIKSK